jgi:hypothetical protein
VSSIIKRAGVRPVLSGEKHQDSEDFFKMETLAYNRIIPRCTDELGIVDVVASSASARMLILE